MKRARPAGLALVLFLAGCMSVGPDYQRRDPAVPSGFGSLERGISSDGPVGNELLTSWWKVFQDPVLNGLMDHAVTGNHDLRIARTRVLQARASSMVTTSARFPEGGFNGSGERIRSTETGRSGAVASGSGSTGSAPIALDRQSNFFLAEFDALWEIDIFGGIHREIEAAQADFAASQEALRDTLITLLGEVARNYLEFRGLQRRLEIARQEVRIRLDNVEITEARAQAGLVSGFDAARARGQLATAEAAISVLETSLRAALHRLGVLLGLPPLSLDGELSKPTPLPWIAADLPVGMPSDLLRRRPDIRKAERELAGATARIGVSTADLFPRFSLTGSFGYQANQTDQLLRDSSNFWTVGPAIRWPILNFRRIMASIEVSKAVRDEALARYERSVLLSLEEVENALVSLSREKQRSGSLAEAVRSNQLAADLAMEQYLAGMQTYLTVIDARGALYTAEDGLGRSTQNHALAFVALYKALGGGWSDAPYEEAKAH